MRPTLRKQISGENPLALSTHAHVAWLCACLHTCTSCCARASVACVRACPKVDFWEISEILPFWRRFFKISRKNKHFIFSRPKAKPEGLKWAAERSGERAAKIYGAESAPRKNITARSHLRTRVIVSKSCKRRVRHARIYYVIHAPSVHVSAPSVRFTSRGAKRTVRYEKENNAWGCTFGASV